MEERIWHKHYDQDVSKAYAPARIPVHKLLDKPVKLFPNKTAIQYFDHKITFGELKKKTVNMATALSLLGVKKGDRVGIHLPNVPEYIISYYAILNLGAVVVNLNPLYTADELTALIHLSGAATLISYDMAAPQIRELCRKQSIDRVIIASLITSAGIQNETGSSIALPENWLHLDRLLSHDETTPLPQPSIHPDDPALIQFTGETTGKPSGAVLTHANITAAAYTCEHWGNPRSHTFAPKTRITLCVLPFSYIYSNILCLNLSMIHCATMILVPKFDAAGFIDLLSTIPKVTFFPAVPTLISAMVNHPQAGKTDLGKKIDVLYSGGDKIDRKLVQKAQELGLEVNEGWGMSETASTGIGNPAHGKRKTGSIGIPLPGVDVKLVDLITGTEEVPAGEPGELLIKGPMVTKGYWDSPEKTAEFIRDGWLHTGDIVRMDDEGFLYIIDRKKDMIISGGVNIYPRDIDDILLHHPKIEDTITLGLEDEYRGQVLKTFIVLKKGQHATQEDILEYCRQRMAIFKLPRSVEFRKELPRSAVGRVLRKELLKK